MAKKQAGWYSIPSLVTKRKQPDRTAGVSDRFLALCDALSRAVEIFTSHSEKEFKNVISNGLQYIARAAEVHRIAVYQLLEGKTRLGQTYVWSHGKTVPLDNELIELPDYPPVVRWVKVLAGGECVNGRVDQMIEEDVNFLTLFKVKSIFMVPVFTHNKFWGFVTLEDQVNYRFFDEDCFDLLCSAASLCANAFIRREMTQNADKAIDTLKRRERLINILNKTAIMFLSQSEKTFEERMTSGIKQIVDIVQVDRMSVWRNITMPDALHASQAYRWERDSGGTTVPKEMLKDVTYSDLAPRWEKILAKGEIVNGPVHLLPEAAILKSFGIVSVLVIPVFIDNAFWGFVLFEDLYNERYFEPDYIEVMRSAAFLCANAVLRDEMERSIAEANDFNRILLDSAPTGFTIIDSDLNVLNCNDSILKTFETTREYYFGHFADFSPEYQDDGRRSDEKAADVITRAINGERLTYEWTHRTRSGKLIPSEITLTPIKYNGKYAALGYQYNLSRIKEMEQEVIDSNNLNRALIDYAPIGLTVLDENLTVINCNDAVLKMFETTKEYYTRHFAEFSPEYQKDGQRSDEKAEELTRQAVNGKLISFEWMHRSSSGRIVPVQVTQARTMHNGKYVALAYQYDLTNFKKMEQEITDANAFNRALIDAAPIGVTVIDDHLNIIDCNEAILQLCGGNSKQYYAEHFYDFSAEHQPDGSVSAEKGNALLKRALNGEKVSVEWVHRTFEGEQIPSEVTLVRVKHKGKYLVLGYQYDLRNTKKMERELAEAEELANAIKEASPISYVLFDENLHAIDCNDAAMQLLDCQDKQFLLEHYWDTFLPEAQPDGNNSLERAMVRRGEAAANSGGKATFEWMHQTLKGELIPMENTLTGIMHKGRKFLISFKYDLRNTKKMMESIREQSELLKVRLEQQELISDISKGFISSGDSESYVKEAIAKLGRYHKVSEVFIFRMDYEHNNVFMAYHWSSDGIQPRMVEFDLFGIVKSSFPERLPDCSTVPVISCSDIAAGSIEAYRPLLTVDVQAFICAPLYVEGRLWGIISVEQCFKPRQWTENEKGFVAMTASTIAGVIMRSIYNAMLQDALRKATAASKAKGEFLSNMSHEMRTPLNAIIGMTAIGKKAADMGHKDYALDKIDNASAHLLGVINDVLDMSKIEANMLELSPDEFSFEKMLQKVVAVVNFRVDEKKQKFKVNIDRAIPKNLIGDDQRLSQVITNLLGNAVKFTPEMGSITLDTHFLGEENGICTIQISVIDTGIGISEEQQTKLFRSFQQAETSTTRKFGGTGLGLAISKSIAELMGGKIWVESEPGKGSTFSFTIQMKRGTEKKQGLLSPNLNLGNLRILVVDDDPDILDYVRDVVQGLGPSCDTAINGEEALRLIGQNGPYDIYFVDWKMPGMDGITLTSRLKTKESHPGNAVVIMISAVEWGTIETEAKKAGVDKFMSKPLFPSSIVDIINECLGMNQVQDTATSSALVESFAGYRILLVEDVEINREIVLTLLEPTLLEIDCAENGLEAVRMYTEAPQKYDMIFMDVQMPEMDGYEATRRIRELEAAAKERPQGVPIIAMTANVFREDIEKSLAAGMNDHIGKPLDFDIVLEKLRLYLSKG